MQKIYGGLSSSPRNRRDIFKGGSITRTDLGRVVDSDIPIRKEIKFVDKSCYTIVYKGDGSSPTKIITKEVNAWSDTYTLDETCITKMTLDDNNITFDKF